MRLLTKVYQFYLDGFRNMKIGKKLWLLIAIKLFILFFIVKWLFFPDVLQTRFNSDAERSAYILKHLTNKER